MSGCFDPLSHLLRRRPLGISFRCQICETSGPDLHFHNVPHCRIYRCTRQSLQGKVPFATKNLRGRRTLELVTVVLSPKWVLPYLAWKKVARALRHGWRPGWKPTTCLSTWAWTNLDHGCMFHFFHDCWRKGILYILSNCIFLAYFLGNIFPPGGVSLKCCTGRLILPTCWGQKFRWWGSIFKKYLEPQWPLFLKVSLQKQGLFQSKPRSFIWVLGWLR